MRTLFPIALLGPLSALALAAQAPGALTLERATTQPMAYHLSLPKGWKPGGPWPVVMAIEAAGMDFPGLAKAYMKARGDRPYILVVPHSLTNGSSRYREADVFVYTPAEWTQVDRQGRWAFDEAGLPAVLADVRRLYGGEARAFLTGWESAGHTVWGMTLRHPEWWRGVAAVSTNYQGRYLDETNSENRCEHPTRVSAHADRATLPVRVLFCDVLPPPEEAPQGPNERARQALLGQARAAMAQARSHGFGSIPLDVQSGQGHGPMPEAVLAWFDTLRSSSPAPR
jgi:hypothetical protein